MSRTQRGTRKGDKVEDTYNRAVKVIESVDFRVRVEKKIQRLEYLVASLRRWALIIVILLGLNWLHDLGAASEMFDWWDERAEGLLSSEFEHEITVMTPLLLALLPVVYGLLRDRKATAALDDDDDE